jgi:hypothetical protein
MAQLTQRGGSFVNGTPLTGNDTPTTKQYEALYVGGQGDLVINLIDGDTLTLVAAVGFIWIRNKGIAVATAATSVVGLF